MRSLAELIDPLDQGAEDVRKLLAHALNPVEVFRGDRARGERALLHVQVSTSTPLGAVALRLGGLVFDHGWLRFLGAGSPRLRRDLASFNGTHEAPRIAGALLVADDVTGGFFALDRGAFGGAADDVFYRAPDTREWESLDLDYRGLLEWACNGDLDAFYDDARFAGWESEVMRVGVDETFEHDPALHVEAEIRRRRKVSIEIAWQRP